MSGWISVNDRLPDSGISVLWYFTECNLYTEAYRVMTVMSFESSARKPTHWVPLPPPPAQEQSK